MYKIEPKPKTYPYCFWFIHQLIGVGKPSSPCPNIIPGEWERWGSGMHSESQHFSPLRACSWDSEYFTEDSIHSSSHTEENMAPSFKRRERHHLLYQVPRATSQKASNTVSRRLCYLLGAKSPVLPTRRLFEPLCSRQPWLKVHSWSCAEAQLKSPWDLQKVGPWFIWLPVKLST